MIDGEGRHAAQLRGRKTDDPDKLARAKQQWADLREDVATLALHRTAALERAMLEQRRWTLADFRQGWLDHPLLGRLSAGMIWAAQLPDGEVRTFRLTEDQSLADASDETLELPPKAQILVPHPGRWPDGSLDQWRQVLQDYRVVQPIHQLGRVEAPPLSSRERGAKRFLRRHGGELSLTELLRSLRARGLTAGAAWYCDPCIDLQAGEQTVRLELQVGARGIMMTFRPEQAPGKESAPELEKLLRELDALPASSG